MKFETLGRREAPAILFFHAMGVTGASSEPVAKHLQDRYFCILPTSTVYCAGQKYISKADEVRQVEEFLRKQCETDRDGGGVFDWSRSCHGVFDNNAVSGGTYFL